MIRRQKKSRKQRGNQKKTGLRHRGAGNRGGRGNAGRGKKAAAQRKHHFIVNGNPLGKRGFKVPSPERKEVIAITLDEVMQKALELKTKEIDLSKLGIDKVLGSGVLSDKLIIHASSFTEKAKKKIEKIGGQAIIIK